ncbi:MAG TPA: peptidylprolyl isomerase [Polyangiaceae bacterium]|nr:peptidylprolyl isomerase [Polyangiaceae bacterium]
MQRTTAVTVGVLFALSVVLVLALSRSKSTQVPEPRPAVSVSAPPLAAPAPSASVATRSADGEGDSEATADELFETLPDGRKAPPLPDSAPNLVAFGVVVFAYEGAQGAPTGARSKGDAKKKALEIVAEAQRDFAAAVAKGDRGSTSDAGRVPRGVLEPAVEYLLFTTKPGEVHPEPVDTPRGYWVVRRNR